MTDFLISTELDRMAHVSRAMAAGPAAERTLQFEALAGAFEGAAAKVRQLEATLRAKTNPKTGGFWGLRRWRAKRWS